MVSGVPILKHFRVDKNSLSYCRGSVCTTATSVFYGRCMKNTFLTITQKPNLGITRELGTTYQVSSQSVH